MSETTRKAHPTLGGRTQGAEYTTDNVPMAMRDRWERFSQNLGLKRTVPRRKEVEESMSYLIRPDIQPSNSSSSLSQSETDSEYEDALGFDLHNYSGVLRAMCDESLFETAKGEERLLKPFFDPLKQAMIEHVMKEFWVIFNQEWSMNARKCNGGGASNSSSSRDSSKQGEKKNKDKSKRERGPNDDQ